MQAPYKVTIHIDEIIFHGFSSFPQGLLREVIAAEISRLLEQQGVPCSLARGEYVTRLDTSSFDMTADPDVKTVGTAVAQAIYGGLNR
jgi:hypothetical protein